MNAQVYMMDLFHNRSPICMTVLLRVARLLFDGAGLILAWARVMVGEGERVHVDVLVLKLARRAAPKFLL